MCSSDLETLDASTASVKAKTLSVESAADSTSCTTGALIINGGVGIGKSLNVCGTLSVTGVTTLSSTLSVTGIATFNSGINATGIVTATSFSGNGITPIGGIIMWSGTIAGISSLTGWALCNGSNGTPDLRNRFIVGAHSGGGTGITTSAGPEFNVDNGILTDNYIPGNFGGKTAHNLSIAELASHTHTLVPNLEVPQNSASGMTVQAQIFQGDVGNKRTHTIIENPSPIVTTVGGSKYHENRPPYYALAFIMRTS